MHVDLNLLDALDALLEEGSVTGAAKRMHLSQPAMSRTLGRLREVTGDQVLVRSGRSMTATPYAQSVRAQVHELLQQGRTVLLADRAFDPRTMERTFTIRCHDAITTAFSAGLLGRLPAVNSGLKLRLLPESNVDTAELRHGEVDLEIGAEAPGVADIHSLTVGHDRLVVAFRRNHSIAKGRMTPARYAAESHLTVSRKGRLQDPIDEILQQLALQRHVVASTPTSSAALVIASQTDFLVVVPEKMSGQVVEALKLSTRRLPFEVAPIPVVLAWHRRYDADRAHLWLRREVQQVLVAMGL